MTLRPLRFRVQFSCKASRITVLLVLAASLCACPQSAEVGQSKGPKWKKLDVELPDDLQKQRVERERLRIEQTKDAQKRKAKRRVEKMQAIFVKTDEQRCLADDDCVITPTHCCDCSAGGSLVALNKSRLPALLSRRVSLCATTHCAQSLSTSPTCNSTTATCQKGICKIATTSANSAGKGIGVEAIPETPPKP